MNNRLFTFSGGNAGPWAVTSQQAVVGEALKNVQRVNLTSGKPAIASEWDLRGVTSNERYVTRTEKTKLVAIQEGLGRANSTCAALIPIRKTPEWWMLPQAPELLGFWSLVSGSWFTARTRATRD